MGKSKRYWMELLGRARLAPDGLTLIAEDVSQATVETVATSVSEELPGFIVEVFLRVTDDDPEHGDLYLRYLGEKRALRTRTAADGKRFHTVLVSEELRSLLDVYTKEHGVSTSAVAERALRKIARMGFSSRRKQAMTSMGITVSNSLWEAAMARSKAEGFTLSEAIRVEMETVVRGRQREW